jgi:hypothetical protein
MVKVMLQSAFVLNPINIVGKTSRIFTAVTRTYLKIRNPLLNTLEFKLIVIPANAGIPFPFGEGRMGDNCLLDAGTSPA